MLLRVVFFVFLSAALIECTEFEKMMREKSKDMKAKCMKDFNIAQETLDNCHKGEFPNNADLKCYMKCIYEGHGLFSDDGLIRSETLHDIVPEKYHDVYGKAMKNCDKIVGSDMCEVAFLTNKCFYEADPETYFII